MYDVMFEALFVLLIPIDLNVDVFSSSHEVANSMLD